MFHIEVGLLNCGNNKFEVILGWNVMVEWSICTIRGVGVVKGICGGCYHIKMAWQNIPSYQLCKVGQLMIIGLEWCIVVEPHA
jgi:ABC-type xylose transport system permease subunit